MHVPSFLAGSAAFTLAAAARSKLWVENAPDHVRPYVIEHYATAQAVAIGAQIYRFPVTGPSSGGKFSILSTSSPASGDLGVLPHQHQLHYENFFCYKGRFQLWTEKNNDENARLMTPGDYGACPRNTTHTFQILDPDTEMTGVIAPGGFEDLFFFLADSNYTSATSTPFVPAASNNSAGGGSSGDVISALESFDVYGQLAFSPRRDLVNGTAPTSSWHTGNDTLGADASTPFFVAKDFGPKFLHKGASYQIVQPFVTPAQSGDVRFTQGTITMSRLLAGNGTAAAVTLPDHVAFEVLEGALMLSVAGDTVTLIGGGVAFVPANTTFSYWSEVAFTKVMYVGAGTDTLDTRLTGEAVPWDYVVFPTA